MQNLFRKLNLRSFLRTLLTLLTRRWWLKLLSVVLALILWVYIIDTTPSLTRSKYVSGVSVSVSGASTLHNYGLSLGSDVYSEYQNAISATVDVSQSQFSKVTNKNVIVTMDVSNIRTAGTHDVPLNAVSVYGDVVKLYPDTVTVEIENLDSRDMPIEISLVGGNNSIYWYNVAPESVNPQQITVSGPMSLVQKVANVDAVIDVTNLSAPVRRTVMLNMQDSTDAVISSRLLTKSASTCSARVEIYPKKELDVSVDASQIKVAEGYQIDGISFQPSTITVAAEAELLEDLEMLPLAVSSNMQPASQTFTTRLSFSELSEFKYVSSRQVYMTVSISEVQETSLISDIPVTVFGLENGFSAELTQNVFSMQVSGPRSVVNALTPESIYAYVDVTGCSEGVYELPIVIGNNSDLSYASITPSVIKVSITEASEG